MNEKLVHDHKGLPPIETVLEKHRYLDRYYCSSYTNLIHGFGEIVIQVDAGSYQGDTFMLLWDEDTQQYGYLSFGWGSCSVCDALEACVTIQDFEDLRDSLFTSVIWKPLPEMLQYFKDMVAENYWSWTYSEFQDFRERVISYLNEKA